MEKSTNISELFEIIANTDNDVRPQLRHFVDVHYSYHELKTKFESQISIVKENLLSARFYKALADIALYSGQKEDSAHFS